MMHKCMYYTYNIPAYTVVLCSYIHIYVVVEQRKRRTTVASQYTYFYLLVLEVYYADYALQLYCTYCTSSFQQQYYTVLLSRKYYNLDVCSMAVHTALHSYIHMYFFTSSMNVLCSMQFYHAQNQYYVHTTYETYYSTRYEYQYYTTAELHFQSSV